MTSAFTEAARRAREAAFELAGLRRNTKDAALNVMADALEPEASMPEARASESKTHTPATATERILAANARDVQRACDSGTAEAIVDRLRLDDDRLHQMASGLRDIAGLGDPVGEVVRGYTLPNGLELRQVRVPFGVVGIIYEARPNVTADAAGLALKSGNAVLLRGSSSARESNQAIVETLQDAIGAVGVPRSAVQLVPGEGHDAVKELLRARGLVDVLIPRGGADLIRSVVEDSTVPVIETGVGNCHVYVDRDADLDMALSIVLNAKVQRPSVCNAAESVLVHEALAATFVPRLLRALGEQGVTVHGDEQIQAYASGSGLDVVPATEDDWGREYLSLDIAAKVVDDLGGAIEHIRSYGSGHSEAIVTGSQQAAATFTRAVDAAAVLVNASTRFTDGGEFGFGAEIGISTQKLHARGPMGLAELTSTKYVVIGDGQTR